MGQFLFCLYLYREEKNSSLVPPIERATRGKYFPPIGGKNASNISLSIGIKAGGLNVVVSILHRQTMIEKFLLIIRKKINSDLLNKSVAMGVVGKTGNRLNQRWCHGRALLHKSLTRSRQLE